MPVPVAVVIGIAVGLVGTLLAVRLLGRSGVENARRVRARLLDEAQREADATRREAGIEAREQTVKLRGRARGGAARAPRHGDEDRGARHLEGGRHRPEAHGADPARTGCRRPRDSPAPAAGRDEGAPGPRAAGARTDRRDDDGAGAAADPGRFGGAGTSRARGPRAADGGGSSDRVEAPGAEPGRRRACNGSLRARPRRRPSRSSSSSRTT